MPLDTTRLKDTIKKILAPGKGILAADESSGTIKRRFDSIKVESTEQTRREYRKMLFTTPGYEKYVSGVILFDETVDQKDDAGRTFSELIASQGIVPGIKTDEGMEEHPMWAPHKITRGLKGIGKRLAGWTERSHGTLAFTKWRQVVLVTPRVSDAFLDYAMHVMAEQAAWSLAAGYVPINEPEILMDGSHTADQCAEATERTLIMLFKKLKEHGVDPALTILKTNMVLSGAGLLTRADTPESVARETLNVFHASLPKELPGIVFLSGGLKSIQATENLNACVLEAKSRLPAIAPDLSIEALAKAEGSDGRWVLSFSYGRALQDDALKAWAGKAVNIPAAQAAFLLRAKLNGLAQEGKYEPSMEKELGRTLASVGQ